MSEHEQYNQADGQRLSAEDRRLMLANPLLRYVKALGHDCELVTTIRHRAPFAETPTPSSC